MCEHDVSVYRFVLTLQLSLVILCHNLTVLQQQHMPKWLNKSSNRTFYQSYISYINHLMFFFTPTISVTLKGTCLEFLVVVIAIVMLKVLQYFANSDISILFGFITNTVSVILIWFQMSYSSSFYLSFCLPRLFRFANITSLLGFSKRDFSQFYMIFPLHSRRRHIHLKTKTKKQNQMVETCLSSRNIIMFSFQFYFIFWIILLLLLLLVLVHWISFFWFSLK